MYLNKQFSETVLFILILEHDHLKEPLVIYSNQVEIKKQTGTGI